MALFEQRISDDEVTAARTKIAAGASLRSAAAEIPCAPSTLSVRIKKAEEAEADARDPARICDNEHPATQSAAREGAVAGDVGPVEILRGALLATKASGQPDWPTRVSAARALATLRPKELEPKTKEQPAPTIVVYDLPPGTDPVLHRAPTPREPKAPMSDTEAAPEQLPTADTHTHMFFYKSPEGESDVIGTWSPTSRDQSADAVVTLVGRTTDDLETADLWRAELTAGRLPQNTEDES